MRFDITPAPPETVDSRGKNRILAHASLSFDENDGLLAGAMLTGFTIVQPRTGPAEARLPARIYAVNGERRRFELLRDAGDDGQDISIPVERIRRALLDAWTRRTAAGQPPENERPEANKDSAKGALLVALQQIAHLLPDGRSVRIRKLGKLDDVEVAILPPTIGDND